MKVSIVSQEEDVGAAELLSMEEFSVLLQACHMAVAEAAAGLTPSLVPPSSLASLLKSICCLLHPSCMKPSHCDLISCCDLASTIAGLLAQVSRALRSTPLDSCLTACTLVTPACKGRHERRLAQQHFAVLLLP